MDDLGDTTRGSSFHFQLYGPAPTAAIRWRLLSGNNRDMGRGVVAYRDAEACGAGIREILGASTNSSRYSFLTAEMHGAGSCATRASRLCRADTRTTGRSAAGRVSSSSSGTPPTPRSRATLWCPPRGVGLAVQ